MLKEFKEFVMRGNVVDLAVGVIIGAAFGKIIDSLVKDIIMPPIGILLGNIDFSNWFIVLKESAKLPGPYPSLEIARQAGAITLNLGIFLNALISFIIVAAAIFMVVKAMNRLSRQEAPAPAEVTSKECPRCFSTIPIKATRCPHCTSEL